MALQPSTGGIFKISLYKEEPAASKDDPVTIQEYLLWDRKAEGGFPGMALIILFLNQSFSPRSVSEPTTNRQPHQGQQLGLENA